MCFSGSDQLGCVSPDGHSRAKYNAGDFPVDLAYCDDPLGEAAHAALIASVDDDFVVGSKTVFSGRSGSLRLGINDCTCSGVENISNSGRFSATVRIERNAAPER